MKGRLIASKRDINKKNIYPLSQSLPKSIDLDRLMTLPDLL
jgi:hypothetical protein